MAGQLRTLLTASKACSQLMFSFHMRNAITTAAAEDRPSLQWMSTPPAEAQQVIFSQRHIWPQFGSLSQDPSGSLCHCADVDCMPVCRHAAPCGRLPFISSLDCVVVRMLTCFAASVDEAEHFGRHRLRQQVVPQAVLHRDALVDHALRVLSLARSDLQGGNDNWRFRGYVQPLHSMLCSNAFSNAAVPAARRPQQ